MKKQILILKISFLFFLFYLSFYFFFPQSFSRNQVFFEIQKGESLKEIIDNLEKERILRLPLSSFLLKNLISILGWENKISYGVYKIPQNSSLFELILILRRGGERVKFQIKEGESLREVGEKIEKVFGIQREKFYNLFGKPAQICKKNECILIEKLKENFPFLKDLPSGANLEGFLFPDTYYFSPNEDVKDIVETILKNFEKKVFLPYFNSKENWYDTLILASILEKEVKSFEDKRIVAGILLARLKLQMPLQVDATVNYITQKKLERVTIQDTKINSPFNTYKFRGLPPTPISNPGLESIKAALNPKESPFLFYLTTPDDKTLFSKTYKEHLEKKRKYYR